MINEIGQKIFGFTINDILRIWGSSSTFLVVAVIAIVFSIISALIPMFYWKFQGQSRLRKKLETNKGIRVLTTQGWIKETVIPMIVFLFAILLILPVLIDYSILEFELYLLPRLLAYFWGMVIIIGTLVVPYLVFSGWWVRKYRAPKYFFLKHDLGFNVYGNDYLIPYQAITEFSTDLKHKMILLVFRYSLLNQNYHSEQYFQLSTKEEYSTFVEHLRNALERKPAEKDLRKIKTIISYMVWKSPEYIDPKSWTDELSSLTLEYISYANNRVITFTEEESPERKEDEESTNSCDKCGESIEEGTSYCPYCGTWFK